MATNVAALLAYQQLQTQFNNEPDPLRKQAIKREMERVESIYLSGYTDGFNDGKATHPSPIGPMGLAALAGFAVALISQAQHWF